MTPLGQLRLHHPGGTVTLEHAVLSDVTTSYDRGAFRAPFGARWHATGSGHPNPTQLGLSGVLQAPTRGAADDLLAALLAALPSVTQVGVGAWLIPVLGAAGPVACTPALRGWRVSLRLESSDAAWTADP